MAQLIVRKIENKVVRKLKERAAKYGVSMEEEHRRILRETLLKKEKPKMSFKDFLLTVPDFGDPDKLRQKDKPRDIDFD
jgi:plasmid stability protein